MSQETSPLLAFDDHAAESTLSRVDGSAVHRSERGGEYMFKLTSFRVLNEC